MMQFLYLDVGAVFVFHHELTDPVNDPDVLSDVCVKNSTDTYVHQNRQYSMMTLPHHLRSEVWRLEANGTGWRVAEEQ